ncbi:pentapeptide repeat-containing protein [Flavobacterium sp. UBA7663]|uniref:pentapeptide repeat-containing protein n=1 Tax=Flavobacterium sp. UBA7663 TaxID=1946557 RepID=UPI0025C6E144|nr:pentapeptide repeat-containing protein [Flavobacterium sp. UBA7663]
MTKKELFEIIQNGFSEWNQFREQSDVNLDLSELDLSKKDLRYYNFSKCNLNKVNFRKSHLGNTNFTYSSLRHTIFKNSYLRNGNFNNSDLRYSDFRATIIIDCNFDNCLFNFSDFSGTKIKKSSFISANIRESYFCNAKLDDVKLIKAHFERSLFRDAIVSNSELSLVKLNDSKILSSKILKCNFATGMLYNSIIDECTIEESDFSNVLFTSGKITNSEIKSTNLRKVNFSGTQLISDNFTNCDLSMSKIFGVSAWKLNLVNTNQEDLQISDNGEPKITIDNIEVAQFIYLLINNEKLRTVINTITSKVVLILGRFTPERMKILNLLREELRHKNYLPILFDFENSANRDITETVTTLATLSKFIIADISDPKSIPQELAQIIPHMPSLPVQPIILSGQKPYGMFEHFTRYSWVLDTIEYDDDEHIKSAILDEIINACENKILEIR